MKSHTKVLTDFAQTQLNFAQLHDCMIATFRTTGIYLYFFFYYYVTAFNATIFPVLAHTYTPHYLDNFLFCFSFLPEDYGLLNIPKTSVYCVNMIYEFW